VIVVVTDRRQAPAPLPEVVAAAAAGGVRWVLLREKDLPRPERAALAAELRTALAPTGARLIVAGTDPLGGDAVHLAAADPVPADRPALVGRSAHDAAELARLTTEDYVTLSPVFPSGSKPGYGPPLRPAGLAALCRRTRTPVLALGGIETPERAAACVRAGAVGVAVMGAVMRAADPAALVARLREAMAEHGPVAEPGPVAERGGAAERGRVAEPGGVAEPRGVTEPGAIAEVTA
jgi:thiamine-phosphate diphosphorylase